MGNEGSPRLIISQRDYYEFMRYDSAELKRRYATYADHFTPGGLVVDIGCGRGEFIELLRQRNIEALGVDADDDMIAVARGKGLNATVADGMVYLLSHPGEFHGVFMAHLIEHIPSAQVPELIRAAAAALRPSGRLMVVTPNPRNLQMHLHEFWIDLQHVRFYVPDTIRWLFQSAGLDEINDGVNPEYVTGPAIPSHEPVDLEALQRMPRRVPLRHRLRGTLRQRLAEWLTAESTLQRLDHAEVAVNYLATELRKSDATVQLLGQLLRGYYPPGEFFVTGVAPAV